MIEDSKLLDLTKKPAAFITSYGRTREMFGAALFGSAMAGKTNMVVARLQDRFVHLPLQLVTRRRRKIDITSNYWRSVIATTGQRLS